jgi:hypothetical protein
MDLISNDILFEIASFTICNIDDVYNLSNICKYWRKSCKRLISKEKRKMVCERFFDSSIDMKLFDLDIGFESDSIYTCPFDKSISIYLSWMCLNNSWISDIIIHEEKEDNNEEKEEKEDNNEESFYTFYIQCSVSKNGIKTTTTIMIKYKYKIGKITFYQDNKVITHNITNEYNITSTITKKWLIDKLFLHRPSDIKYGKNPVDKTIKLHNRDERYSGMIDLYNWKVGIPYYVTYETGNCTHGNVKTVCYKIDKHPFSRNIYSIILIKDKKYKVICDWNFMSHSCYMRHQDKNLYVNFEMLLKSVFLEIPKIIRNL